MEDIIMEDVLMRDPTTDETFHLRVDSATAKRAKIDPIFATKILSRYVRAHSKESIYNEAPSETPTQDTEHLYSQTSEDSVNLNSQLSEESSNASLSFWSRNETLALISAYDHFKDNLNHYKKKKFIWNNIETYLSERGIHKTERSIETKWKNLLRTYKNIKDNNKSTGRGTIRFQFMKEMEEVMGERPLIQNSHTVGVGITNFSSENNENESGNEPSTSTETPKSTPSRNKNEDATTIFTLKRRYLRERIQAMSEKKKQREEYLTLKRSKEEREERKLKLKERELDIEERKLKTMEIYLQHQLKKK